MSQLFVNLNTPARLPGILTVQQPEGPYYGRVIHAESNHYTPPQSRRSPPFVHNHYHIVLVTAGRGFFEIEGKNWSATPGEVFFTSPRQSHQFLNSGRDTTRYAEVTFEFVHPGSGSTIKMLGLDFAGLLSAWTNRLCEPVLSRRLPKALARVLAGKIEALVNRGRASPQPDDLELGALLAEILTVVFRNVFRKEAAAPDKIDQVRDVIRTRYREELHLTTLAKDAGLSPSHLSRRFKARFGRSPISYQLELRLQSACELLRTRGESLAEIAAAVGFEDVFYFSRLFRRRLGEAPGSFRKASQSKGRF
ncbi:AraC family transcriptional regulator [Opitutaceae bacterium TAV4]|nr:AraC family transcriptional regulator [Opitutaceae bacterium TAV4]RRK00511.1 AraC family transcriptional regulator [Opitutaceae bacterium TAV3]